MNLLDFRIIDFLDILLVAFLLYQVYALIRGTAALNIFLGVAAIYVIWKVVVGLEMRMLSEIFNQFLGVGFIALIVVFQQEIRKFLLLIGSASFKRRRRFFSQLRLLKQQDSKLEAEVVSIACRRFAETKTGALIVFARNTPLQMYAQTGDRIQAELSVPLLEAIFNYSSPLHDGAVIIADERIVSARSILPVSESESISARLGLRHRAAIGITEKTDAIAVVVSEETGQISACVSGKWEVVPPGALRKRLQELLNS
jgi:diadenylate cyclase